MRERLSTDTRSLGAMRRFGRSAHVLTCVTLMAIAPLGLGSGAGGEPQLVALEAPTPDWIDDEDIQSAHEAAGRGNLWDYQTDAEIEPEAVPTGVIVNLPQTPTGPDYLFLRPGIMMVSPSLCTMNFIYDLQRSSPISPITAAKIGTAGHCAPNVGSGVVVLAAPTLLASIGTVIAAQNGGIGNDWALVDVFPQWLPYVQTGAVVVGGPGCASPSSTTTNDPVKHVGHGIATGLVVAVPRVSLLQSYTATTIRVTGLGSGGDSGSPMILENNDPACFTGAAAGIITHCARILGIEPCDGTMYGTAISRVPATVSSWLDCILCS